MLNSFRYLTLGACSETLVLNPLILVILVGNRQFLIILEAIVAGVILSKNRAATLNGLALDLFGRFTPHERTCLLWTRGFRKFTLVYNLHPQAASPAELRCPIRQPQSPRY